MSDRIMEMSNEKQETLCANCFYWQYDGPAGYCVLGRSLDYCKKWQHQRSEPEEERDE